MSYENVNSNYTISRWSVERCNEWQRSCLNHFKWFKWCQVIFERKINWKSIDEWMNARNGRKIPLNGNSFTGRVWAQHSADIAKKEEKKPKKKYMGWKWCWIMTNSYPLLSSQNNCNICALCVFDAVVPTPCEHFFNVIKIQIKFICIKHSCRKKYLNSFLPPQNPRFLFLSSNTFTE